MRVAFVTTEYVTEYRDGGGLGNYLSRMCRVLLDHGHSPEVFVISDRTETINASGVVVHRVDPSKWRSRFGLLQRVSRMISDGSWAVDVSIPLLASAAALAGVLRRREREVSFAFVQSADYQASGLFVRRRRGRPHVVRSSGASDLWEEVRWRCMWERASIRRADLAYAPSQFVARHYSEKHGLTVGVVRPPLTLETQPSTTPIPGLPSRYLMHFGQIGRLKGSDVLAAALLLVWKQDPSVRMVWAGRSRADMNAWRAEWGEWSDNVVYLGSIDKRDLYQVLSRAEASVLPSWVDNLPNTAIESLMCDKPVIGTRGASIDELVVDGKNGLLVAYGDVAGLADAILKVWRREFQAGTNLAAASPIWSEMQPHAAIDNLFAFVLGHRGDAASRRAR